MTEADDAQAKLYKSKNKAARYEVVITLELTRKSLDENHE